MLGWFDLNGKTSLADVEWLCARAAGYGAGYTLVLRYDGDLTSSVRAMGPMDSTERAILDAVHQWEAARMSRALPDSMKAALQDVEREFRLERVGPGEWELIPTKPAGPAVRVRSQLR